MHELSLCQSIGAQLTDIEVSHSARKGDGLQAWLDWLRQEIAEQRERLEQGRTALPAVLSAGTRLHGLGAHGHRHHPRGHGRD